MELTPQISKRFTTFLFKDYFINMDKPWVINLNCEAGETLHAIWLQGLEAKFRDR